MDSIHKLEPIAISVIPDDGMMSYYRWPTKIRDIVRLSQHHGQLVAKETTLGLPWLNTSVEHTPKQFYHSTIGIALPMKSSWTLTLSYVYCLLIPLQSMTLLTTD